jgi:hypothetical protein
LFGVCFGFASCEEGFPSSHTMTSFHGLLLVIGNRFARSCRRVKMSAGVVLYLA